MKFIKFTLASILASVFLVGCATQQELEHSEKMYEKQLAAKKDAAPTPIFQMVAIKGQTIELKGVERFSVYSPNDSSNAVPAYTMPENAGLKIITSIIDNGTRLVLGKFGLDAKISDNMRGASDKDVNLQINRSNTFENPFK